MSKYCIGIDLGGTFIKFALLDKALRPGKSFQLPTPLKDGSAGVVRQMVAGARQLIAQNKLQPEDILGVGIGSPGPIQISKGLVISLPNIPGMDNVPLRDLVAGELKLRGVLENDANAAAYGEYLCGAGKGGGDMVLLTLGTGVGSGIIIDHKILYGSHEIGAELGHMIVQPNGEQCNCGQKGCLERYASATFLSQYAARLIQVEGRVSLLKKQLDAGEEIDAKALLDAAKAGDALAAEVWERATFYLAVGCVNICRIFDPDEIILAGGMTKAGEDLLRPVREHFQRLHWSLAKPMTQIKLALLGNDAGVIGAAGVAWAALGGQK